MANHTRVEQLMSQPVRSCRTTDDLQTAAQLMWEHDLGVIPVVDDAQRVVGMVTDRDVCMAAYTRGARLSEIPVGTAMAREICECSPRTSLDAAEQLMREARIRRLPVVDGARGLVGMLSLNDLARDAARSRENNGGQRSSLVQTLAAISEPRVASPRRPKSPESSSRV